MGDQVIHPANSASGRDVLVVDDDSACREALAEALRDEGYIVETASNGAEALSTLRAGFSARVIILDLMMPVLDGRGFLVQQRADKTLAGIPVIVISAGTTRDETTDRFDNYLAKPTDLTKLFQLVARLVDMSRKGC